MTHSQQLVVSGYRDPRNRRHITENQATRVIDWSGASISWKPMSASAAQLTSVPKKLSLQSSILPSENIGILTNVIQLQKPSIFFQIAYLPTADRWHMPEHKRFRRKLRHIFYQELLLSHPALELRLVSYPKPWWFSQFLNQVWE